MKGTKIIFRVLGTILISISFTHCSKDAVSTPSQTEHTLISNTWSVDYFFSSQNLTSNYSNAKLLFSSTGIVGYQANGSIVEGKWIRSVNTFNSEVITLSFNTNDLKVTALNKPWQLLVSANNALQFEDVDGGGKELFRLKTE